MNATSNAVQFDSHTGTWNRPEINVMDCVVTAAQIDGLGHTNNRCYVDWCEAAAWQHSQQLGLGLDDYQQLDRAMAVRHAEYDYLASTYEGEVLKVGTWLSDLSAAQMRRNFEIVRVSDGVLVARASWLLVCIELSSGRAKRLPPVFVEVYGGAALQ